MAGFDSIIVLLGLLVIPALYLIYNQMIKKRRKAAIKFSNLMFVKSAISNKKKSKRDMWIFMISLAIIALMMANRSAVCPVLEDIAKRLSRTLSLNGLDMLQLLHHFQILQSLHDLFHLENQVV